MTTTLKDMLNKANPQELADFLRLAKLGDMARALPTYLRGTNPDAAGSTSPYDHSTLASIVLPDDAKAAYIFRATTKAGSATAGEMTVKTYGTTPGTTEVAVSPSGNIVFLESDEWTDADILYMPEKGAVVELTLPVVSNAIVLPAPMAGAILLEEAESLVGTTTGKFEVIAPAATNSTGSAACFNLAKTSVLFKSSDAVTSARIKVLCKSATDLDALLEAASPF